MVIEFYMSNSYDEYVFENIWKILLDKDVNAHLVVEPPGTNSVVTMQYGIWIKFALTILVTSY